MLEILRTSVFAGGLQVTFVKYLPTYCCNGKLEMKWYLEHKCQWTLLSLPPRPIGAKQRFGGI